MSSLLVQPSGCDSSFGVLTCTVGLYFAIPSMQAVLQEVVCVGVTPRELSMMALSALTTWQAGMAQQQTGLQPQHVAAAVRGWMGQHDSRVRARTCDTRAGRCKGGGMWVDESGHCLMQILSVAYVCIL